MLTEGAVRASDKRARFVGVDAYEAAGGVVMRDLFEHDDGGWLQDPACSTGWSVEKLQAEAEALAPRAGNGSRSRRRLPLWPHRRAAPPYRQTVDLTEEERASPDALRPRYDVLEEQYRKPTNCPTRSISGSARSRPRSRRSTTARSSTIRPRSPARASSSASTATAPCVERGYVRPEDEAPAPIRRRRRGQTGRRTRLRQRRCHGAVITIGGAPGSETDRAGGGRRHQAAVGSACHRADRTPHAGAAGGAGERAERRVPVGAARAVSLGAFYHHAPDTCLEIAPKSVRASRPSARAEGQRFRAGDRGAP